MPYLESILTVLLSLEGSVLCSFNSGNLHPRISTSSTVSQTIVDIFRAGLSYGRQHSNHVTFTDLRGTNQHHSNQVLSVVESEDGRSPSCEELKHINNGDFSEEELSSFDSCSSLSSVSTIESCQDINSRHRKATPKLINVAPQNSRDLPVFHKARVPRNRCKHRPPGDAVIKELPLSLNSFSQTNKSSSTYIMPHFRDSTSTYTVSQISPAPDNDHMPLRRCYDYSQPLRSGIATSDGSNVYKSTSTYVVPAVDSSTSTYTVPPTYPKPFATTPPPIVKHKPPRYKKTKKKKEIPYQNSFSSTSTPPEDLLCPITGNILVHPVLASDGVTYERDAILQWLRGHTYSPITRTPMSTGGLKPDNIARVKLRQWRKQQFCYDF